jgi:UDP-glucose 4-epimerase
VREPAKYYRNNVANTLALLAAMREAGVDRFIFSSTAAIFGTPQYVPIDERHPRAPINPYGRTKNMVEDVLGDYERAYGLRSVCLRYFNAAGADPEGRLGERHDPESHLIPLALQAASGRRAGLSVYGTDYDTPDGTCIRDYVHVSDLCEAHWLALESLRDGASSQAYNLGNGNGFSVLEVIETAKKVTGVDFAVKHEARRAGDPPRLVADSSAIKAKLGWSPRYADLDTIIAHAWAFERSRKPS